MDITHFLPLVLFAFNLVMLIISALIGWMVKSLFGRIRDLEIMDNTLNSSVAGLREALPTYYTPRSDFKELGNNIFEALRRIEDKIDKKADKN
jgi:hypothetical protein